MIGNFWLAGSIGERNDSAPKCLPCPAESARDMLAVSSNVNIVIEGMRYRHSTVPHGEVQAGPPKRAHSAACTQSRNSLKGCRSSWRAHHGNPCSKAERQQFAKTPADGGKMSIVRKSAL